MEQNDLISRKVLLDAIKNDCMPLTLGMVFHHIHNAPAVEAKPKVETNFFDKEEIYENCTVQVLTNTVTGEVSVGWWRNGGQMYLQEKSP